MSRVTLVVNRHDATSETFQRSLAGILAAAGHEVTLHALEDSPVTGELPPGVRATTGAQPFTSTAAALAQVRRSAKGGYATAAARARARFGWGGRAVAAALVAGPIIATRPEVLLLGFSGIGVAIRDALELVDPVPLVVSCRGTDELVRPLLDPSRGPALADLFDRASVVHAVADAVADAAVALGADRSKVTVIRPAVDLARWPAPDEADRVDDHREGPLRVVAVGRLAAAKGLDDLVSAVAIARDAGTEIALRIIGDGPHRDALALRIARSDLGHAVVLVGALPPAQVAAELAAAQVFVSASLSEGISNVVLEAMASARPVITTDVGGMPEVVTDGVDGCLVPPGRPDLLARRLVDLAADPQERARLGSAGRARVAEAFTIEQQSVAWRAVYDATSGAGTGRGSNPRGSEGDI